MRDYGKLKSSIWDSKKFKSLKDDDSARVLYFFLHTCTHGNASGCFRLKKGYAIDDLNWSESTFDRAIDRLVKARLIDWDEGEQVVCLIDFLKHSPITNKKHGIGAVRAAIALPDCAIKYNIINELRKDQHAKQSKELKDFLKENGKTSDSPIGSSIDTTNTNTNTKTNNNNSSSGETEPPPRTRARAGAREDAAAAGSKIPEWAEDDLDIISTIAELTDDETPDPQREWDACRCALGRDPGESVWQHWCDKRVSDGQGRLPPSVTALPTALPEDRPDDPPEPSTDALIRRVKGFWYSDASAEEFVASAGRAGLTLREIGDLLDAAGARVAAVTAKEEKRNLLEAARADAVLAKNIGGAPDNDRQVAEFLVNNPTGAGTVPRPTRSRLVREGWLIEKPGGFNPGPKMTEIAA